MRILIPATKLSIILLVLFMGVNGCQQASPSTRLLDAAEAGDLATVTSLVSQGVGVNQQSPVKFGWTPLMGAVFHNNTNVIHYLVESGADVNLTARNGETSLMLAISHGDDASGLVQYLIEHGAHLDARDNAGLSAFDYALSTPAKPKIIELLNAARTAEEPNAGKNASRPREVQDISE